MKAATALAAGLLFAAGASPVLAAGTVSLDLEAGRLGDAVAAISAGAGVSIAVDDGAVWSRTVPALKGRMTVERALNRLLRGSGAKAIAIDGANWRIVAAPAPRRKATPRAAPPAAAEEPEDIIVTASKRDTRLRDFAGSISILDGADLAFGGERGMDSVASRLASLSSTHLGAGRNKLFIRGIADSSFTGPTQATVGQYLGDMRLTYNAPDPDLRLYDIKTVEVLEGPQGTLYGSGSLGGVIRIVRNAADLDEAGGALSAGFSATQHGKPGGDIGGTVNLPLMTDRVGLRVVGYAIEEGGYIDDVWRDKADINRTRIAGGRASLRVAPGDGWSVDLGGVFQRNDGRDSQYADRALPPLSRASRVAGGFDAEYRLADAVIRKDWDDISLLSSTGFVRQTLEERYDASAPGGPDRLFVQHNRTRMFSSESRLWRPMRGGFGWVVGASHVRNRTDLDRALGFIGTPPPSTGVSNRIRETTLYGELSVEAMPGLTVTGGARQTWTELAGGAEDAVPVFSPTIALARAAIVASREERRFLPSGSISAAVLTDVLLFARYQEGFRPGGLAVDGPFVRRFRNDHVATMETGLRYGAGPLSPLSLSFSLSHTRWKDIQADFIDTGGLPSTDNIGDGRIYSMSLALAWRATPRLSLDMAVARNDSRVTDPAGVLAVALASSAVPVPTGRIPNVARMTARAGADYRAPLGDELELHLSGWGRYVGRSRIGIGPLLGGDQGNYFDSAVTARIGRPDLGVTLGVTNLTDAIGNRFALGTPFVAMAGGQVTPLRPRTIRLAVDKAF